MSNKDYQIHFLPQCCDTSELPNITLEKICYNDPKSEGNDAISYVLYRIKPRTDKCSSKTSHQLLPSSKRQPHPPLSTNDHFRVACTDERTMLVVRVTIKNTNSNKNLYLLVIRVVSQVERAIAYASTTTIHPSTSDMVFVSFFFVVLALSSRLCCFITGHKKHDKFHASTNVPIFPVQLNV